MMVLVFSHGRSFHPVDLRRPQAGFSIIELMVALTLTAITMTSVYYVGAASSRHMLEQTRISVLQTSLDDAMDRIRSDFERAGFGGTPNCFAEATCGTACTDVAAIEYDDNPDVTATAFASNNVAAADRVRLIGNYATADQYVAAGFNATGTKVYLNKTWQSWRRSFALEADFTAAFAAHRVLHIVMPNGKHFFPRIASCSYSEGSITFESAVTTLAIGSSDAMRCLGGWGEGAVVSPLVRIQYNVRVASSETAFKTYAPRGGVPASDALDFMGVRGRQLVREELEFDGATALAVTGQGEVVLDYAVDFRVNWWVDTATTGTPTLALQVGSTADAYFGTSFPLTLGVSKPEDARLAIVWLAARTPERNPRIYHPGTRLASDPFNTYRVNPAYPGAARVRQLRQEIYLHNLASRGLR